jgi:inner membrane protein
MSPVTHFFAGWLLASVSPTGRPTTLTRREKALVVAAAVAPDIDGIGIVPELLTRNTSHPLLWFSQYHHSLHTLAFALACTLAAAYIVAGPLARIGPLAASDPLTTTPPTTGSISDFTFGPAIRGPQTQIRRSSSHPGLTAVLVFISFHLHLLCDLIGARGPDGDQWHIPYLKPFSNTLQLTWHGQWALNAWQNFAITGFLLLATFWIAWRHGNSPLELISEPANQIVTRTLRQRFGPTSVQP